MATAGTRPERGPEGTPLGARPGLVTTSTGTAPQGEHRRALQRCTEPSRRRRSTGASAAWRRGPSRWGSHRAAPARCSSRRSAAPPAAPALSWAGTGPGPPPAPPRPGPGSALRAEGAAPSEPALPTAGAPTAPARAHSGHQVGEAGPDRTEPNRAGLREGALPAVAPQGGGWRGCPGGWRKSSAVFPGPCGLRASPAVPGGTGGRRVLLGHSALLKEKTTVFGPCPFARPQSWEFERCFVKRVLRFFTGATEPGVNYD